MSAVAFASAVPSRRSAAPRPAAARSSSSPRLSLTPPPPPRSRVAAAAAALDAVVEVVPLGSEIALLRDGDCGSVEVLTVGSETDLGDTLRGCPVSNVAAVAVKEGEIAVSRGG